MEVSTVYGKFVLVRKLAEGGMAEIFLARQVGAEGFERNVVIKRILRPLSAKREFVEMFLHEAKLAARLSHQNIVQIHDLGFAEGCHYICMEYLPGEDFSTIISACRKLKEHLPLGIALKVVADAAHGLHYAHEMKDEHGAPLRIVHRDVSPSNLFVTYEGQVKVLDFGVAKAETQVVKTAAGAVWGKHQYMAPEQTLADDVDRRADVYSLGVALYQALTLTRPFSAPSVPAILDAVRAGQLKPLHSLRPDLPADVEDLLHRAMALSPDDRFQTADELAVAIEMFMEGHASVFSPRAVGAYVRELAGEERITQRTRIRSASALAEEQVQSTEIERSLSAPDEWAPIAPAGGTAPVPAPPSHRWGGALAIASGACAAVLLVAAAAWMAGRPGREARRDAEEIRRRIDSGQLLSPDGGALRLLAAARTRFPDRPEIQALTPALAQALLHEGERSLREGRLEASIQQLGACLELAPGDGAAAATLAEAKRASFATAAGMVRAGELWIDRYEYPNVKGAAPMTKVDWEQAGSLCRKAGKRLCTEAEWERACAGPGKRAYPYGSEHEDGRCQEGPTETGPAPSGSRERCVTEEGVADLSGNVSEWTSTQVVPGSAQRVVRGGAWHPGPSLSCAARDYFLPGEGGAQDIGFRCCL